MKKQKHQLTVFYDGDCIVCRREMEKYRQRDKEGVLVLVNIAAPTFDSTLYDRDLKAFMAKLHVRDETGTFYTGVEAFARIWRVLPEPELHLLAAVVALPGISLLARSGYWMFAHTRRFLPKAVDGCDDDTCHIDSR